MWFKTVKCLETHKSIKDGHGTLSCLYPLHVTLSIDCSNSTLMICLSNGVLFEKCKGDQIVVAYIFNVAGILCSPASQIAILSELGRIIPCYQIQNSTQKEDVEGLKCVKSVALCCLQIFSWWPIQICMQSNKASVRDIEKWSDDRQAGDFFIELTRGKRRNIKSPPPLPSFRQ